MSPRTVRRARRTAAPVVTVVTVAAAARYVAAGGVPDLGAVDPAGAVLGLVLLVVANDVLCGWRWHGFLPRSVTRREAVRRYAEAAFWGAVVPLAGDLARATDAPGRGRAVVADRVLAGAVVAAAAVPGALALGLSVGWVLAVALTTLAVATGAAIRIGLPGRGASTVARAVVLTLAYVGVTALALEVLGRAAGIPLGRAALAGAPLMLLAASVPSVGGIGPGVLGAGAIVRHAGGTGTQAATVTALLLVGLVVLLVIGAGSLALRLFSEEREPLCTS